MHRQAAIRILRTSHAQYLEILQLNPRFRPEAARLKLEVEIRWKPRHAARDLAALQQSLLELCPSLAKHQCRGQIEYRILQPARARAPGEVEEAAALDAPLFLAHLVEHVIIDVIAAITGEPLVSGATGARRDSRRHFDIFVECPHPAVASLAAQLALAWMTALLHGVSLDGSGRPVLEVAARLYRSGAHGVRVEELREQMSAASLAAALHWLEASGFTRDQNGVLHLATPGTAPL